MPNRLAFALLVMIVGSGAGLASQSREAAIAQAPIPEGIHTVGVKISAGPFVFGQTRRFVVRPVSVDGFEWRGPPLSFASDEPLSIGQTIEVVGEISAEVTAIRSRPLRGSLKARRVSVISGSANPFVTVGNAVRRRVMQETAGEGSAHGLLAGFLVGETAGVAAVDIEAMRRAGLSHFVAVSGSNVALFLMGWWIITMPLSLHSRPRAWLGLVALGVFIVATRWEPSVVRASGMAGLMLVGRLMSWPIERWFALGATVTVVLLISPELSESVGFQLSVAATMGVMASPTVVRRPRWLWTALYVTMGAQLAVAPLLFRFGPIPALAPLANLAAAPLVSLATALSMGGVLVGGQWLIAAAAIPADLVLKVAWLVYSGPQLDAGGLFLAGVGVTAIRVHRIRAVGVALAVSGLALALIPSGPPTVPIVEFLDVGQGDAALLRGPHGEVVLIDGGPDPTEVLGMVTDRGVSRIDLVIASHIHADHVTGLAAVLERTEVNRLWHSGYPGLEGPLEGLLNNAPLQGVEVTVPAVGTVINLGSFRIEVLAPLRRYDSPNDHSLVVLASANGHDVLFSGDVETFAQSDLGPITADVLKVPHQGALTSDMAWLGAIGAELAVIPVGPNQYGHPAPEVIAVLRESGARVYRTDLHGTVSVELSPAGIEESTERNR
jgi:competence protein ComEC